MPIEILRDANGNPVNVMMTYIDYQEIIARIDTGELLRTKLMELQKFLDDVLSPDREPEELPEDEMEPPDKAEEASRKELPASEEPGPNVRYYKCARGYYLDRKLFRVLKGSLASSYTSEAFDGIGWVTDLRQKLIDSGTLARENEWGPYTFTKDYLFNSPSAAACIVDGNSRSGPEAWGRP